MGRLFIPVVIFLFASTKGNAQMNNSLPGNGITETKMVNPDIDSRNNPWCYLQKSTTVIGMPYMPQAIQVTYDGSIFTRNAELCFFYGKPLHPVMARQKSWYHGWIPIVKYNWKDKNISYEIQMFGFSLNGKAAKNTLQFVKVKITNKGNSSSPAYFTVATRSTGVDHRMGDALFSPDWIYSINKNNITRSGKLIYSFSGSGYPEAIYKKKYTGPFKAADFNIKENTPVCLINYHPTIKPGSSVEYILKMPRLPIDTLDKPLINKIENAGYEKYRQLTINYWVNLILKGHAQFEIPEKRVNDAVKASIVHMMLATRERDGKKFMTDGLPYPDLFLTSFVQHEEAFDYFGFKNFTDQSLPSIYAKQDTEGLFYDGALLHGKKLGVAQGQTVQALCEHYFLTRDKQYIDTVYPKIKAGIKWLQDAIMNDQYDLMPPAWPYDNEMILGHYTSNNLWAILGLRSAIRIARDISQSQDASEWSDFEKTYRKSLLKAIDSTFQEKGYAAPGLYNYVIGEAARKGFEDWQTNQEWENMSLVYPSELLSPDNPIVDSTLDHIRKDRYREGIMTYRIFLHQYITINMMDQELAIGESKHALIDLYNVLLHLGSTYEGFENLVLPWQDRNVPTSCPPPHAWASSKLVCFLRNMLIREFGGEAGLNEHKRSLYLFSLISPDWCKEGKQVAFQNAKTEMGTVSASMKFTNGGAIIKIVPEFHTLPHNITITVPYFVNLTKFSSDASNAKQEERLLIFSPDVRKVNLSWKIDPKANQSTFADLLERYRSESTLKVVNNKEVITQHSAYLLPKEKNHQPAPLSFNLVRKAFIHEYTKRFNAFKAAGGYLDTVAAPPLIPENGL